MPDGLVLAVDQGTTNTKALLVDKLGAPVFRASASVELRHSPNGFVEQDPLALWDSVRTVMSECVQYAAQSVCSIDAIAISNQRETAAAWDSGSGAPVGNAISWQCIRSSEICQRLEHAKDTLRIKTGLPLSTLISAGKWAWLLQNDSAAKASAQDGILRLGTIDSWLITKLTGGLLHATDFSNASRTGLLNLEHLDWDAELLDLFGISLSSLPKLQPSSGPFGKCRNIEGLDGVPILAAIGDSHAAMFGHGNYCPGTVKATYGTGSSLMALTSRLADDTPVLARTVAWSIAGETQFALEGNIAMTGSAVQWVGEFLRFKDPAKETAALAATVPDADGVYFVPAMVGLGAPYWDTGARGTIAGLGRSHTSAHLARAAVDAIAFQVADVFLAMERAGGLMFPALHADGGATRNQALMQFQADVLGRPILRSANEELSAIGAAWLAGLALGWWHDLAEIARMDPAEDKFTPAMESSDRDRLYSGWQTAVARARLQSETKQ
jgi:glycerol kinase